MSTGSSSTQERQQAILWNPVLAVLYVVLVYFVSQLLAGVVISLYPWLQHWSSGRANDWLNDSTMAQFVYILLAEGVAIWAVACWLKRYKAGFGSIGLRRPRLKDVLLGLAAAPVYYVLYLVIVGTVSSFVHGLNIDQQQQIGFTNVHGLIPLVLTFVSLVVLPPLAEEIMMRGFMYTSLRRRMRFITAALVTSAIFASAHLPEGGSSGPLWIAALDTFTLSLVLCYLREKTGSLWSSITLHSIKNGIAFAALFVIGVH